MLHLSGVDHLLWVACRVAETTDLEYPRAISLAGRNDLVPRQAASVVEPLRIFQLTRDYSSIYLSIGLLSYHRDSETRLSPIPLDDPAPFSFIINSTFLHNLCSFALPCVTFSHIHLTLRHTALHFASHCTALQPLCTAESFQNTSRSGSSVSHFPPRHFSPAYHWCNSLVSSCLCHSFGGQSVESHY